MTEAFDPEDFGENDEITRYKAEFLNTFVKEQKINTVLELGCGDGSQLDLINYPQYIGVDLSPEALSICRMNFEEDLTKCFIEYNLLWDNPTQDLALSLDAISHFAEDGAFHNYMYDLFKTSHAYIIIYAANHNENTASGLKHRCFTDWINIYAKQWHRVAEKSAFPRHLEDKTHSRFHIFKKETCTDA